MVNKSRQLYDIYKSEMTSNKTSVDTLMTQTTGVENTILLISCVVATVANIFVMALIIKVRRLRTSTNFFVFSLCLCNTLISLLVIPMRAFAVDKGVDMLLTYKYIVIITILIYVCNLTAVARHRLRCITEPMTYVQTQTKRDVMKIVAITWTLPLVYCLLPFLWFNLGNMSSAEIFVHNVYKMVTIVFLLVPLAYILFVFITVYKQARNIKKQEQSLSPKPVIKEPNATERILLDDDRIQSKQKILIKFVCSSAKMTKPEPPSRLPQVLLIAPSPDLRSSRRNSANKLFMEEDISKNKLHQENALRTTDLSISNSLSSLGVDVTGDMCSDTSSIASYIAAPSSDDDSTNSYLSPKHHGIRQTRSVSISSLTSITSRISTVSLKQTLRQKAYELRASLAFFIVAIAYMITWIPVIVLTFINIVDSNLPIPRCVEIISLCTISFNAVVDPFVYGLLLPSFKRVLILLIRRKFDKVSISRNQSIVE